MHVAFNKGDSPNDGKQPAYVVVDFPHYNGPAWDKDNPTVSIIRQQLNLFILL